MDGVDGASAMLCGTDTDRDILRYIVSANAPAECLFVGEPDYCSSSEDAWDAWDATKSDTTPSKHDHDDYPIPSDNDHGYPTVAISSVHPPPTTQSLRIHPRLSDRDYCWYLDLHFSRNFDSRREDDIDYHTEGYRPVVLDTDSVIIVRNLFCRLGWDLGMDMDKYGDGERRVRPILHCHLRDRTYIRDDDVIPDRISVIAELRSMDDAHRMLKLPQQRTAIILRFAGPRLVQLQANNNIQTRCDLGNKEENLVDHGHNAQPLGDGVKAVKDACNSNEVWEKVRRK